MNDMKFEIKRITVLLLAAVFLVFPAIITAGDNLSRPAYQPGELIVKLKKGTDVHQLQTDFRSRNMEIKNRFDTLSRLKGQDYLLLTIDNPGPNVETALAESLSTVPGIESVSLNYTRRLYAIPNDPLFERQWGFHNTGQTAFINRGTPGADINAPAAWDIDTGSPDVVIAVIDTGVDYLHEDLWENMWTNPGEIPGNRIDDDGNGYIDDVYGYDFAGDLSGNNDSDPMGLSNHGSHVAGIIAARGNNGIGTAGVCWDARIMALKAFRPTKPDAYIYLSDEIEAFEYVIMMKTQYNVNVVAINCSYGGSSYSTLEMDIIETAGNAGIVVCAAAGNGGDDAVGDNNDTTPEYPASYGLPNLLSVAATDMNDQLAGFSNYGMGTVDIAAPGTEIESAALTGKGDGIGSVEINGEILYAIGMEYAGNTFGITKALYYCGRGLTSSDFPTAVNGHIALIERGENTFAEKAVFAQNAGAAAAVIFNNASGDFLGTLGQEGNWIPVVSISRENGLRLVNMGNPTVTLKNMPSDYEFKQGTSMAAPMVSGAVGLLAARFPGENVDSRVLRILLSGDPLPSLQDKIRTGARLNIGSLKIQPPLSLYARQEQNRSLLQTEYINILTWQANPQNQAYGITGYRIYQITGKKLELLAEVNAGQLEYLHRKTEAAAYTYAVVAVDSEGSNGEPAVVTVSTLTL